MLTELLCVDEENLCGMCQSVNEKLLFDVTSFMTRQSLNQSTKSTRILILRTLASNSIIATSRIVTIMMMDEQKGNDNERMFRNLTRLHFRF